jgi:hypothetical protein
MRAWGIMGLEWKWGIANLLLLCLSAIAQADDTASIRDDVFFLMGASVQPPGTAAYCNKYVEPNERLIDAAAAWNKRNDAAMRRIIQVLQSTGGMSDADKQALNRFATKLVKQSVESAPDPVQYCQGFADLLDRGEMDLDKRADTAPALARIMAADEGS